MAEKTEGRKSTRRRQLKKLTFTGGRNLSPGRVTAVLWFGRRRTEGCFGVGYKSGAT